MSAAINQFTNRALIKDFFFILHSLNRLHISIFSIYLNFFTDVNNLKEYYDKMAGEKNELALKFLSKNVCKKICYCSIQNRDFGGIRRKHTNYFFVLSKLHAVNMLSDFCYL